MSKSKKSKKQKELKWFMKLVRNQIGKNENIQFELITSLKKDGVTAYTSAMRICLGSLQHVAWVVSFLGEKDIPYDECYQYNTGDWWYMIEVDWDFIWIAYEKAMESKL